MRRGFRLPAALAAMVLCWSTLALAAPPTPLLAKDHPVAWWFAFKFNAQTAPYKVGLARPCPFGGSPQPYAAFSQEFAFASADDHGLNAGRGLLGTSPDDPLGATFGAVYGGGYHYVVWNDQFYRDPAITGCAQSCSSPWGHSKGLLAWDDSGAGVVLQVTTPSWPAAGAADHPRQHDGNTLGCVRDNDVLVSQHFFALRLSHEDTVKVLKALANASVVTDPVNPQLVRNGGPADIRALVPLLGRKSPSRIVVDQTLSSGVRLISKPSKLPVPPWQLVSATLGSVPLRAATWWAAPKIPSTAAANALPACWSASLPKPSAVEIATSGMWDGHAIGLRGGAGPGFNHAKVGVSTDPARPYVIFGDMNQQGALAGNCASSQNGRGGLFYVVKDADLAAGMRRLIGGDTAPLAP